MINPPFQLAAVVLVIGVGGRRKAGLYILGYFAGQVVLSALAFGGFASIGGGEPNSALAWVKIALGILFVYLAYSQVHGRPRHGAKAEKPSWMVKLVAMSSAATFGAGVIAATVLNVKNISLMVAVADLVATSTLASQTRAIVAVVFTILSPLLVAAPWIYAEVRGPAADEQLARLGEWLTQTSWVILTFLFIYMSASLIGSGLETI